MSGALYVVYKMPLKLKFKLGDENVKYEIPMELKYEVGDKNYWYATGT